MACLFKRQHRKTWYVSYYFNGKRHVKSLKTTDSKLARLLKKETEVRLEKGINNETRQKSVELFLEEYKQVIAHRKHLTNENELYCINHFIKTTNKKTINSFNAQDIYNELKKYEDKAANTYNNVLGSIKRFFKVAIQKGYILKNPCEGIPFKKIPEALPHFFTDEEYLKIEQAAKMHHLYPMIVTARYTGLRLRELIYLEWEDFDWEKKIIKVLNKPRYAHTVKNYQARIVPLADELRNKLLPYIRKEGICFPSKSNIKYSKPYSEQGPKRSLKEILKNAKISLKRRIGWHEFRHTFASHLVQKGVQLYKISKWLGHSSLDVTQIYAHFAPLYDQEIEKLSLVSHPNSSRISERKSKYRHLVAA